MEIGVTYPQTEIEADPGAVRQFTQAVEQMGFAHVLGYDHVLGANTASRPDWKGFYNLDSQFHEPLLLFTYMAAVSSRLSFVTGVMIMPQRPAALVAKQAACLDVLCNGRFRLGIGTGWNQLEFEALGVPFEKRGARMEEQVSVMRALWQNKAVAFKGEYHSIPDVGLNPLPVQRPIPVWFGGGYDGQYRGLPANEAVMRRIARLGDGWIPYLPRGERSLELITKMRALLREYGRDPATFGIHSWVRTADTEPAGWAGEVKFSRDAGMTHLSISTMGAGLRGVDAHLKRLEDFRKAVPF